MSNSPSNRKQRRAVAAEERKAEKKTATVLEKLQKQITGVAQVVKAMVDQVEGLRNAFNGNHVAYSQALNAVDGHLSVMRSVINDIHLGKVSESTDGNIDWDTYYQWYNEYVEQERAAVAAKAEEQGTLVSADEVDEIVFGGDVQKPGEPDVQACTSGPDEVPESSPEPSGEDDHGD